METTTKKSIFKPVDEIIRLMKESKKQSKIESQQRYYTPEFQEVLKKLRAMKTQQL
jgi:hypothetical protein